MEYATGQQVYNVTVAPTEQPITVDELKLYAKISGTAEDALLAQIIKGVTLSAERYIKQDFITRTYRTFRDVFGDRADSPAYFGYPAHTCSQSFGKAPIALRRSPVGSIVSVKYYSGGALATVDAADYYLVVKPSYAMIAPVSEWPTPDLRMQAVQIEFTAGYGAASVIPADIKDALLAHATSVYQNRGDCDSGGSCECKFAPAVSMAVYNGYRIIEFVA